MEWRRGERTGEGARDTEDYDLAGGGEGDGVIGIGLPEGLGGYGELRASSDSHCKVWVAVADSRDGVGLWDSDQRS